MTKTEVKDLNRLIMNIYAKELGFDSIGDLGVLDYDKSCEIADKVFKMSLEEKVKIKYNNR